MCAIRCSGCSASGCWSCSIRSRVISCWAPADCCAGTPSTTGWSSSRCCICRWCGACPIRTRGCCVSSSSCSRSDWCCRPTWEPGLQTLLNVATVFAIVIYFQRAPCDATTMFWLGMVMSVTAAVGGFEYFRHAETLPVMNKNAFAMFPLAGLFGACLALPFAGGIRGGQLLLASIAGVDLAWVFPEPQPRQPAARPDRDGLPADLRAHAAAPRDLGDRGGAADCGRLGTFRRAAGGCGPARQQAARRAHVARRADQRPRQSRAGRLAPVRPEPDGRGHRRIRGRVGGARAVGQRHAVRAGQAHVRAFGLGHGARRERRAGHPRVRDLRRIVRGRRREAARPDARPAGIVHLGDAGRGVRHHGVSEQGVVVRRRGGHGAAAPAAPSQGPASGEQQRACPNASHASADASCWRGR